MLTIPCPIRETAVTDPHRPALITTTGEISYGELDRWVTDVVLRMRQAGIEQMQAVGWAPLGHATDILLLCALLRIGAIACPVDGRFPEVQLLRLKELLRCSHWIRAEQAEELCLPPREAAQKMDSAVWEMEQPSTILLSSGTTSQPKAIVHTLAAHLANAEGANANLPLRPGDRWLWSLPMFHVSGLAILFRTFSAGAAIALRAPHEGLGQAIVRTSATHLSLVPRQLMQIVEEVPRSPQSLKAVLLGGSSCGPGLVLAAMQQGYPLYTTYGMTETASQITTSPPACDVSQLLTAGRLLPRRELRLTADGEIQVRGPIMFLGYLQPPGIRPALDSEGWFSTGDLGQFDEQQWLTIRGRRDNMFISGGENIHPEEIESALSSLSGVHQVLAVPVPDPRFGEVPVCLVQAAEFDPRGFESHLLDLLPRFKVPRRYFPWPEEMEQGPKPSRAWARAWVREQM